MGSAQCSGEDRALRAIKEALNSPLLNNNDIHGAKNILLNISSGSEEATMDEIGEINDFVQEAAGFSADLIWGNTYDANLGDKIAVTVIATGFDTNVIPEVYAEREITKTMLQTEEEKKSTSVIFDIFTETMEKENVKQNQNKVQGTLRESKKSENTIFNLDDDSFIMEDDVEIEKEEKDKAQTRIDQLKTHQENTKKPVKQVHYMDDIELIENEPAYKRQNMIIDNSALPSENKVSKYTLSDDENKNPKLKGNSYLHDLVD